MVTTILTILKIIGIVLLCILGFIILLLLMILFVPLKYTVSGSNVGKINAHVKITWLLFVFSFLADYNEKLTMKAKVFGIRIWGKGDKTSSEEDNEADTPDEFDDFDDLDDISESEALSGSIKSASDKETFDKDTFDKAASDKDTSDKDAFDKDAFDKDTSDNDPLDNDASDKDISDEDASLNLDENDLDDKDIDIKPGTNDYSDDYSKEYSEDSNNNTNKRNTFFNKLDSVFDKLYDFIIELPFKIIEFIEKPAQKVEELIDTYIYYDRLLHSPGTQYVIDFLKKHTIPILKDIRPRKSKIRFEYQSDDPVKVSSVYEIYGMLYMIVPKNTLIIADYGEDKMEFDISIKGKMTLGIIGYHAARIILDKKVKAFKSKIKREK